MATSGKRDRRTQLEALRPRWQLLSSVLDGLYIEVDKLAKKSPVDEITELALRRVNTLIQSTKELLAGDEFVDSIEQFVPAGENPELRDVLMILRELKQGMDRQDTEYSRVRREAGVYN